MSGVMLTSYAIAELPLEKKTRAAADKARLTSLPLSQRMKPFFFGLASGAPGGGQYSFSI
jgi:hypothetical protein